MRRRATKRIFADGALREPGDEFEASKKWRHTEPAGGPPAKVEKPTEPELKRKEIMAELAAAGVKFDATAKNEVLLALLEEEKKRLAPAASGAPPKNEGTGNQDVL